MYKIKTQMKKVDVIVPCYNEGPRVGKVLKALSESEFISKIVFVNDGSTDNSLKVARLFPEVKIVSLKRNIGKGGAVKKALKYVTTEAVFLCDADIRGLEERHIKALLDTYVKNKNSLVIGFRTEGTHTIRYRAWDKYSPKFDGERIIPTKDLKNILKSDYADGFGLEVWMNHYFKRNKKKVVLYPLRGVKDGPLRRKNVKAWANEFSEIALAYSGAYKQNLQKYRRYIDL